MINHFANPEVLDPPLMMRLLLDPFSSQQPNVHRGSLNLREELLDQ
jgi:hypothetical protein